MRNEMFAPKICQDDTIASSNLDLVVVVHSEDVVKPATIDI